MSRKPDLLKNCANFLIKYLTIAISGLGKFHALLLLTCGLCLMSTIVETLNIGFVIPLIEMECELSLTLSQKGVLNSSAFVGQFCYYNR